MSTQKKRERKNGSEFAVEDTEIVNCTGVHDLTCVVLQSVILNVTLFFYSNNRQVEQWGVPVVKVIK